MQFTKEYWKFYEKYQKNNVLVYQRRKPKMSDLEVIALCLLIILCLISSYNFSMLHIGRAYAGSIF